MSYRIRVVPEVEVWLGELRDNDPDAANILDEAVDALREGGAGLGPPLVVPVEAPAQDTHPDLDRAYQQQLKKLTRLRRAVADAATSRKRVKLQIEQLEGQAAGLGEQRGQALETGDDELAAFFRTRQSFVADQLADLHPRYADLRAGEERLTAAAAKRSSTRTPSGSMPPLLPSRVRWRSTSCALEHQGGQAFASCSRWSRPIPRCSWPRGPNVTGSAPGTPR
jgi:hypothetical protein